MSKPLDKVSIESAVVFFKEWAGSSYIPHKETPEQGKQRNALALARAEQLAQRKGWYCQWRIDELDSSEWNDEKPAYQQYICMLFDKRGECIDSLCGIDFGREGSPIGAPYARVVEAALCHTAMTR